MAHRSAAGHRGQFPPRGRSPAESGPGNPGDAAQILGRRAAQARRHSAGGPLGEGAGQLRRLPRADRDADREPALPRLRDAGKFRHHVLDRSRLHRAPAVPPPGGLRALDRADARCPALLPRADGRDARRDEARVHSAAHHDGGTGRLHHRGHGRGPRAESLLCPLQGHAGRTRREAGDTARRGREDHPRGGAAGVCGAAEVHAHRVRARDAHDARGRGPPGRAQLLPRQDPRVHDPRHGSRRNPPARRRRSGAAARGDARDHARDRLQRRFRGVPQVSAHRSALLRPLARGALDAGCVDRQALRRQGGAVLRLPAARALRHQAGARGPRGVLHGGRGGPGVYLLNTYDLPSRPLYNLTALTLHESAPGHAFQMPIAMEHKDQPMFRQLTYISAYGEGWALYCEQLGLEMGMYESAYERFGMLGYQIWRAARLVVDTGIHAQGWTREQAMDYLKQYTALPEHEIATEVDRYIAWPGQALSYYLGERTLLEARSRAEKALGDRFNVRAFHDAVLELGSVPLPVLETQIDRFIAGGGRGPYPDME